MQTFKIENDVPIPVDLDEIEEDLEEDLPDEKDDEDPEVPGKRGRKPQCPGNDHVWEKINDTEERCKVCHDIFPCRNKAKCWHYDCYEARGEKHPWAESVLETTEGPWPAVEDS